MSFGKLSKIILFCSLVSSVNLNSMMSNQSPESNPPIKTYTIIEMLEIARTENLPIVEIPRIPGITYVSNED